MDLSISDISVFAAIAAGAVSFLSPCVLPLVPGYVSFIAGSAGRGTPAATAVLASRLSAAFLALWFVFGFSTVFIALGASATAMSQLIRVYSYEASIIGGLVIIVFGLFMTGLFRLPFMERDARYHGAVPQGGPLGAYLLGLAFAFGWTPCIGPILGAILTVSAVSSTAANGVALLALYSLGLGIPFLLAAMFTQALVGALPRMRRAGRVLNIASGVVMIAMGLAMATGQMTRLAFWLLETFPAFGSIG